MRGVGGVTGKPAVPARGAGRAGAGFAVPSGGAGAARGPEGAGPVGAVGLGLLAVQEDGDAAARDRAARRRAEALLQELSGLQLALLGGEADSAGLERLAALESGEDGADPALRALVQAVVLRARVELARRERNPSASVR